MHICSYNLASDIEISGLKDTGLMSFHCMFIFYMYDKHVLPGLNQSHFFNCISSYWSDTSKNMIVLHFMGVKNINQLASR